MSTSRAGAARVPNLRYGIALILGFGVLVNYIDRTALSVATKPLHDEFGITPEQFGWLSGAFFWIYACLQIPIGVVLDRFGLIVVSRVGAALWTLASIGTALGNGFASLFIARSFLGVAEAPTFPANAKAVGYWFPKNERGLATSLFDAAAKFSNVIGVPLVGLLLVTYGWRGMFAATALLSFVFFLVFTLLYRNPSHDKRLSAQEREYIAAGGGESEVADTTQKTHATTWYLLRQRKVLGLTIGFGAYDYLFALLLTWLPGYLQATFGVNILKSTTYAAIAWGVATVTDIVIGGWLSDYLIRRGGNPNRVRKTLLIVGMILGLAIVGAAYTKNINVAIVWISIAAGGIAFHAPIAWSLPGLISPKDATGRVGGIMNFVGNLTSFAAPVVTGYVVESTHSFSIALLTAGVVIAIGIVSYTVVLGRIEPVPEPVA